MLEYQGVGRDVTEREQHLQQLKDARTALADYRHHLDRLLKTMPNAVMVFSLPDQQLIFASTMVPRVFGHPVQRFLDAPQFFRQVAHPEDLPRVMAAMQRGIADGFVEVEHRVVHPDGRVRWVARRAWVTYDDAHRPVQVNDYACDITDHKAAENTLRLLRAAVHHSTDAIVIINLQLEIVCVNPAFTRISGYPAEDVLGKNPVLLLDPAAKLEALQELHVKLAEGQPFTGELQTQRKDGSLLAVEWSTSPIRDEQDVITHFVTTLRDVTASKYAASTCATRPTSCSRFQTRSSPRMPA
ncbi:MAG: PAS domain S-box protein [Anaerolineae bacterium]|nr:PAS domain S-box protein [Anaerolineae bacterium]